jgi:hypothetical protein
MKASVILMGASLVLLACGGTDPSPGNGEGGSGSATSTSASSSSSSSGQGGADACDTTGIRECETTADCCGRYKTCEVELCVKGKCEAFYDALGVVCDPHKDPLLMCDGQGSCVAWSRAGCYEPTPLKATCPLCDDGDPATADWCIDMDTNGVPIENPYCEHYAMSEGSPCGQAFSIVGGKCCPWPDGP